jgi:proteasome assembly chaperone (PAC2) family protein
MALEALNMESHPTLGNGTMLLALTGWMDGGLVSTGTLKGMMQNRQIDSIASIDPDPFYIYNFPGSMEIATLFRPEVKYADGMVSEYEMPLNAFYCDAAAELVFFTGKEPNLRWGGFADCIFAVAERVGVNRFIFMGSFGGTVPHTREPRLFATVSHDHLKPLLRQHGCRFSNYEGPSGFATLLLTRAAEEGIEMMSLVAEIPGYLQGLNPLSIEAVTRRLSSILNIPVDVDGLRRASDEWEIKVTQAVEEDAELAETVRKLENDYDDELIGRAEES